MPQPGTHSFDQQKRKLRKDLEEQGVDDRTAEAVADDAVHRQAETGDPKLKPRLPPQASPSANRPGVKHHKPDDSWDPAADPDEI
jgi:hypothetical protein